MTNSGLKINYKQKCISGVSDDKYLDYMLDQHNTFKGILFTQFEWYISDTPGNLNFRYLYTKYIDI